MLPLEVAEDPVLSANFSMVQFRGHKGYICRERPLCRYARFGTARRPFPTEQSGESVTRL